MINKTQEEIMKNWVGDINNPLVTIRCITYNHEKYISDALDGFLMQETTFPFEVIVHDDASTDNTANIIKEYEKKFPLIIKPIYEKENQYSKHDGSLSRIVNSKIKGKYIAFCEGDDYWIDSRKLQKQFDYMENHKNCVLCTHNTQYYDLNNEKKGTTFNKWINVRILNEEDVFFDWNVHTSSFFIRTVNYFSFPKLINSNKYWFGDFMILCWSFYYGNICCLPDVMSVYNYNNPNGVTYTVFTNDYLSANKKYYEIVNFLFDYNQITNGKYCEVINRKILSVKKTCLLLTYDKKTFKDNYQIFLKLSIIEKMKVLFKVYLTPIYFIYKRVIN